MRLPCRLALAAALAGARQMTTPAAARAGPAFARLFEANLRHGYCVGVCLDDFAELATRGFGAPAATPHPTEARNAASMGSSARAAAFCGGRAALHSAMRACGIAHVGPIARAACGSPVLPPGVLASISHTHGLAASLVRLATPGALEAIGLDVEYSARTFAPRLGDRVLTESERAQVSAEAALGSSPQAGVLLRFSLKEALYKALHQLDAHEGIAFRDVTMTPLLNGSVTCRWDASRHEQLRGLRMSLTWSVICDYYVTTAHVIVVESDSSRNVDSQL